MAAFVTLLYVLAGALHGFHDLDVANSSGKVIVSIGEDGGQSEKGIATEHHCHGCFSVSIPSPVTAVADVKSAQDVIIPLDIPRPGRPPGIDPPPPKFLT